MVRVICLLFTIFYFESKCLSVRKIRICVFNSDSIFYSFSSFGLSIYSSCVVLSYFHPTFFFS